MGRRSTTPRRPTAVRRRRTALVAALGLALAAAPVTASADALGDGPAASAEEVAGDAFAAPTQGAADAVAAVEAAGEVEVLSTSAVAAVADVVVQPGRTTAGAWTGAAPAGPRSAGFELGALPTAALYLAVDVATPGGTGGYRARVRVDPDGRLTVGTAKVVDGREGDYRSTTTDRRVQAGEVVNLEADLSGAAEGDVRVRAWPSDEDRPGWQHVTDDAGRAPVGGTLVDRTWAYLSGGASTGVVLGVGDLVAAPVAAPVVVTRPDAASTGVPAGTKLTPHYGDLVITTPGARYDALDVHGFVVVQAPDVKITRSLIRGGVKDGNRGLVTVDHANAKRFVIEDSTIRPDKASVWYDGIKGSNFTARRVNIWGTVDNIKVHGDDVLVEDSYLHDSRWYAYDPNQRGPSHNDGVQVLGGDRVVLRGNTVEGARNAAVQVTQDFRPVRGLELSGNWFDDGQCSIKITHKGEPTAPEVLVRGNRFDDDQTIGGCAVLATHRTSLTAADNVWDADGRAVVVRRWG